MREQLRQGVDQIKIMVSGGVASPYDPLDSRQFSLDEIRAAVEEADAFGRYTQAHAYTAEAITRAVSQGVRTDRARQPHRREVGRADEGERRVPRGEPRRLLRDEGAREGIRHDVRDAGEERSRHRRRAQVAGDLQARRRARSATAAISSASCRSTRAASSCLRREVLSPIEIIRQATLVGAEIVRMPGKLGVVKPGAFADILVVDGDPIKKLELLTGQGENLSVIMKAGRFHKNRLAA